MRSRAPACDVSIALLYLTTPCACFVAVGFQKIPEPFQIALDLAFQHGDRLACAFRCSFQVIVHPHPDACLAVIDSIEGQETIVRCA
jgi:hypothetical protein